MNGTTWLDRTNYFETLPVAPARARALARGGPDGRRSSTRSARRTSTTSARSSRTRSAGRTTTGRTARGTRSSRRTCSRRSTPTTTRRSARWRTSTPRRSRTSASSSGPTTRPNNAVLTRRRRRRPGAGPRAGSRATSGRIPANPSIPPLGDLSLPAILGEERPRDRPRQGPAAARLLRVPGAGLRRPAPRRARHRRPDPRRRQGQPAPSPARPRGADRPGRRAVHARLHRRRVDLRRLGDRPAGRRRSTRVEAAFHEELERLAPRPRERRRAGAGQGADREPTSSARSQRVEERADRLSMYATLFDDPGLVNRMLPRYLAVTAERDPRRRGRRLPARQPGRPDVPARAPPADAPRSTREATEAEEAAA